MGNNMLDKIHEIEKEFEDEFGSIMTTSTCEAIKKFYRTSLIALLEGEIERLEGVENKGNSIVNDWNRGFDSGYEGALGNVIAHLQSIIKDLTKPI